MASTHVRVFVDSGPLIALADRGDAQHLEARRFFGRKGAPLLTHVGVLGEAVTFLRYRFSRRFSSMSPATSFATDGHSPCSRSS